MKSASKKPQEIWVAVSGGFDPIHIGHVRMFKKARALGDKLVVIINNDHWLRKKKGFVFMPQKERAELVRSFPCVDKVIITKHKKDDPDMSVSAAIRLLKPAIFANGGDRRKPADIPEVPACKEVGAKMVFNVGEGGKVQSSSWMIRDASRPIKRTTRPWGEFYNWDNGKKWNLKTIYIAPGKRLSLQYHKLRSELWLLVDGDATATIGDMQKQARIPLTHGELFTVAKGAVHRLESKKGAVIVEVAQGIFDENDIIRIHDDHGRVA